MPPRRTANGARARPRAAPGARGRRVPGPAGAAGHTQSRLAPHARGGRPGQPAGHPRGHAAGRGQPDPGPGPGRALGLRVAGASPAVRARHLAAHDELVLPIVRAFGGLRIGAQDGGSLFAFRSPTDAVHCAAALQDSVAADARPRGRGRRARAAIGVHQGEVHLERKGAAGAPLATARSLRRARRGEVWLTRGVYLTMSRSEAPAEEMGPRALAGLSPSRSPTYRLVRGRGAGAVRRAARAARGRDDPRPPRAGADAARLHPGRGRDRGATPGHCARRGRGALGCCATRRRCTPSATAPAGSSCAAAAHARGAGREPLPLARARHRGADRTPAGGRASGAPQLSLALRRPRPHAG